ncbi:MAG TPA: ComF family protein [Verrucomicrobiae bacterium]|nr:ComF family protein [Verrucomicrobiae bacterium]
MYGFANLAAGLSRAVRRAVRAEAASAAIRDVGAALLESDCPCCRHPMGSGRHGACEACWGEIRALPDRECALCGALTAPPGAAPAPVCACLAAVSPITGAAAHGEYAGRLRELIHALKFHDRGRLAIPLGRLAADALERRGLFGRAADAAIVPVPISRQRLRRRGYNQAELIAREVGRCLHRETGGRGALVPALKRAVDGPPQAGRSRSERWAAVAGAYAAVESERARIAGRTVLLVDDVLTTGATARECARILGQSGAGEVIVAVVARTPAGSGGRD